MQTPEIILNMTIGKAVTLLKEGKTIRNKETGHSFSLKTNQPVYMEHIIPFLTGEWEVIDNEQER
jgi:hypothetical protein